MVKATKDCRFPNIDPSVMYQMYDNLTGAKDGGNDSDRKHWRPSEVPGYIALFQPFGILKHME